MGSDSFTPEAWPHQDDESIWIEDADGNRIVQLDQAGIQVLADAFTRDHEVQRSIEWVRENDLTTVVARILGLYSSLNDSHGVVLETPASLFNNVVRLTLQNRESDNTASAKLEARTRSVTLLDESGKSSFIKLNVTADLALSFGTHTLPYVASSTVTRAVPHGLTNTPVFAMAIADRSAVGILTNCSVSWDAVNLTVQGTRIDGAAGTASPSFWWFALG